MIEEIKNTIREKYHLKRDHRNWKLNENPVVTIRAPDRHSIGFSLDNKKFPPFAFFSDAPPEHLAKMCDAIIALEYQKKLYLFVVEQKTAHKGDSQKQLANGKYFCDWLMSLYCEHGYLTTEPILIGLLIWQPREKSVSKGPSTHRGNQSFRETDLKPFNRCFEVPNTRDIVLIEIINHQT